MSRREQIIMKANNNSVKQSIKILQAQEAIANRRSQADPDAVNAEYDAAKNLLKADLQSIGSKKTVQAVLGMNAKDMLYKRI